MLPVPLFALLALAPAPALKRSDVVFMYEAAPQVYRQYGATVLAWGGTPNPKSLREAAGIRFFGSVGMVTEFARFHTRFPARYEEALCRDLEDRPVKVPWLTDHQHQGIPYWWCCTNQPLFRQYLRERVVETIHGGAAGLHVDDHMGTAGGLWLGICFCPRCLDGFRQFLAGLPETERARRGLGDIAAFDFRAAVHAWMASASPGARNPTGHPLWDLWTAYQCRAAAAFMQELRDLAARTAGRPVPVGANAGLLWPRHLADYRALDLFSAETDHHAAALKPSDAPLLAYRMAEAVGRPYAATASGGDWAFIKERGKPGLVRAWIALAYAAGQLFMAPHRQWCHTPEKGTHWYDGPAERFAPLYRFVRENATLFDGYETHADLTVVMPHRSFVRDPARWQSLASDLAAAGVSWRLLVGGDDIVDIRLPYAAVHASRTLLAVDPADLEPADRKALTRRRDVHESLGAALAAVRPAVRVDSPAVRALPRTRPGSAVVHLLNRDYDPAADAMRPRPGVRVSLDLRALGVPGAVRCRIAAPDRPGTTVPIRDGVVTVPLLDLWAVLLLEGAGGTRPARGG